MIIAQMLWRVVLHTFVGYLPFKFISPFSYVVPVGEGGYILDVVSLEPGEAYGKGEEEGNEGGEKKTLKGWHVDYLGK